jgi:3-carboxy-cis,cis-muconate cycloisomerase
MTSQGSPGILDALLSSPRQREIFSDRGRVQGMLAFEAALARASARAGLVPAPAAEAIAAKCRAELFDLPALGRGTALAGNPAIPLVRALTELVGRDDEKAARWVHFGATSQDAMDTGLSLQMRDGLAEIDADLGRLCGALARLARAHRLTPMAGRTWLQQAQPLTFGLKAAGWLCAAARQRARLRQVRERVPALQLGGAVGTLAGLGPQALAVAEDMARDLGLPLPELPWHAERDRVAEAAAALGLLVGALGKMARDVSLLMQSEVAEVREPAAPGRGGSSAMPQKRNPVGAAATLAAAARVPALVSVMLGAMVQEHERGLGSWQAEWETLPEIFALAGGALRHSAEVMAGLEVDPERMARNLEATSGAVYAGAVAGALSARVGRELAHEIVEQACRRAESEGRHLREVLAGDAAVRAHLPAADLARLFDAGAAAGAAAELVDRALAAHGEER